MPRAPLKPTDTRQRYNFVSETSFLPVALVYKISNTGFQVAEENANEPNNEVLKGS